MTNNTNFKTFHQMGSAINDVVRQATGRDNVQNIDMDYVTVAQNKRLVEKVITGDVASFYTPTPTILDHLIAQINPVQEGSGDPSPENIRPISGWTGANVTRTGKNLLNPEYRDNLSNNIQFYKDSGYLIKAGETYTLSISGDVANGLYFVRKSDGSNLISKYNNTFLTYTSTEDILVYFNVYYSPAPSGGVSSINCQLEIGSSATSYEPYSGSTAEYTFPSSAGTVYGGELTINQDGSGTLVVDRASVDLSTITWTYMSTATRPYFRSYDEIAGMKPCTSGAIIQNMLCSQYKSETWSHVLDTDGYDKCICEGWIGKSYIAIRDTDYTDATTFTTAMSGVQMVYELSTPVTYELTDLDAIETLAGENNIFADTGNVTVMYSCYEEMI